MFSVVKLPPVCDILSMTGATSKKSYSCRAWWQYDASCKQVKCFELDKKKQVNYILYLRDVFIRVLVCVRLSM